MSEKLIKIFEEERKRVMASVSENMEAKKRETLLKMEAETKALVKALKTQPLKRIAEMVELLEKDGFIKVSNLKMTWGTGEVFAIDLENKQWRTNWVPNKVDLHEGKYEITLIVEPLEETP